MDVTIRFGNHETTLRNLTKIEGEPSGSFHPFYKPTDEAHGGWTRLWFYSGDEIRDTRTPGSTVALEVFAAAIPIEEASHA